jgi:uncharacterized protein with HEPN domain
MPSPKKWRFRIEHILEAIERIQQYTAGLRKADFAANQMAVDAVIHNFQVIGEAARHVPAAIRAEHTAIPWSDMQKMRHVLVHDYDRVDISVVWTTIQNDLPPLAPLLQKLLQETPESS